jgi:hypothetical protein
VTAADQPVDLREALLTALRDDAPADGRLAPDHATAAVLPVIERHIADQVRRWQVIAGTAVEGRRTAVDGAGRDCEQARRAGAVEALRAAARRIDNGPGRVIGTREHILHTADAGEWLRQLADATETGHDASID